MKRYSIIKFATLFIIVFAAGLFIPTLAMAHCDTMDGPVIKAAKEALETGNINLILLWVKKDDEKVIKEAFEKTLKVRGLSSEAKEMADMYFFETLVRIHRAGEGAPYTGIKPAGTPLESGVVITDEAIAKGSDTELLNDLTALVKKGVHEMFKEILEKKNFKPDDVEAGREYIEKYVVFIHYVERLYESAEKLPHGHFPESGDTEEH